MKLYKFLSLCEEEQYNSAWSLGIHLDTHIKGDTAINLYLKQLLLLG
jgi:hypothetical protein